MYDKQEIGARIKKIRINSGKTQEKFGELFSASKGNVAMWEKGASLPNKKRLLQISNMANISLDKLLYGELLPYIRENLSFSDVENYFDEMDLFVKDRLTDMIYNVNEYQYSDVFERGIYQEILNLCQNTLKTEVDFFITEGIKTFKSFEDKSEKILRLNVGYPLVNKFLNGIPPKNIDYISAFRFIVGYKFQEYRFDEEIINYDEPLMEIYEILVGYFKKNVDYDELITKASTLSIVLKDKGYSEDELGRALINFIDGQLQDILFEKSNITGDTHDT
ncbi:helix-turn-helix transcriptional regulator [Staphylococcus pseudintermedius]|uniref:helix-turn-helix domain-containing protein n=1 Tax=Staphylococcus TaxID=1279 RepID=UPI000C1BCCFD|nr:MULTISPECIES: helix-turn-helix transcriptional regulator [Staphylococcus]EGQ0327431.1 helix-turn-helix transcriptional regulator [Staphylococcus pseudintermedius]EGQ1288071.1 helix-turn-helix domain-containing protein [Staphylococcus pseudintermedius]EGQ1632954.1 helix-turn-helix transcriptional regulator [Staphylococcus pseudintermedius]EGQ1711742.1 XRE family transcriptional regulator [Staphylococcus pseudintermedius]EGQ1732018.1 XRE family transcriptional regulator [Staphylococcus pseudi